MPDPEPHPLDFAAPPPLRWGVIGLGRFGRLHARVLSELPECRLVAAANRNPERLTEAREELPGVKLTTDYRGILADPDIDAVSITTHWQDHFEIARDALSSGKHVLLEKPMASTTEQCRQLLAVAADSPGIFLVGHICRFDPRVTLAKEAIDEGRIGNIVSMHARRNLPKAPGSLRLDKISPLIGDGIHDADLMLWFLGRDPTEVYGRQIRVHDFRYPDLGWAMLHFGEDAIGVIETIWCLPENVPTTIDARFEVVGTEGTLRIDAAHTGLEILDSSGLRQPDTVYWPTQHGEMIGALRRELAYFTECARSGRDPEVITPGEAARALATMEAAEKSAALGSPVPFSFS